MRFTYDQYHDFSAPLEGRVPGMYCDILGLVTCAVGNLIDPIRQVEGIPWTLADGSPADMAQVRADWHLLKDGAQHYSKVHWRYALAATKSRLTDEAIDGLVLRVLGVNESYMRKAFAAWDAFPADAQLAIMSMCWAVGAGWPTKFPNLKKYVLAQDWEGCVASCKIREAGNPGVVPRNAKNRFCFHNAALVKAGQLDPARLCWPDVASEPSIITSPARDATEAAKAEADLTLAAWQAHDLCPFVTPGSGRALLDFESKT
jgi:hypothetical protein